MIIWTLFVSHRYIIKSYNVLVRFRRRKVYKWREDENDNHSFFALFPYSLNSNEWCTRKYTLIFFFFSSGLYIYWYYTNKSVGIYHFRFVIHPRGSCCCGYPYARCVSSVKMFLGFPFLLLLYFFFFYSSFFVRYNLQFMYRIRNVHRYTWNGITIEKETK